MSTPSRNPPASYGSSPRSGRSVHQSSSSVASSTLSNQTLSTASQRTVSTAILNDRADARSSTDSGRNGPAPPYVEVVRLGQTIPQPRASASSLNTRPPPYTSNAAETGTSRPASVSSQRQPLTSASQPTVNRQTTAGPSDNRNNSTSSNATNGGKSALLISKAKKAKNAAKNCNVT